MPVELSDLLGNERWVEVEINGVTFNVAYRPSATTLRTQALMAKQGRQLQAKIDTDEEEQVEQIGRVFCEIVCDWNLTRGGEPLPLTPETATRVLPGPIFNAIMEAIGADRATDAEEKKLLSVTSDATLPTRARLATAPNGTRSSEPRSTWA